MKVGKLCAFLVDYYLSDVPVKEKRSVLLLGAPGIGKSTAIYEAAERIAKALGKEVVDYSDDIAGEILENPDKYFVVVDFRLTEAEPSDLLGIPRELNDEVRYKPLLWARVLNKCAGFLVLDEITNVVRQDVQAIAYKLALERKAGFVKLSDRCLVVAAGKGIWRPTPSQQLGETIW